MKLRSIFIFIWGIFAVCLAHAGAGGNAELYSMQTNLQDLPSLQRGAQLYVNYCAGCHSLKYMRYGRLAKDIGIVDASGEVDSELVKNNLIFTGDKIFDTMRNAMSSEESRQWFGVRPPDLSLIARVRGVDWLYTYLLQFYADPQRPWGVNNLLFPDVAMPNVLLSLQGEQVPHYRAETVVVEGKSTQRQEIDRLELQQPGSIDSAQFDVAVRDLVNFLAYVAEPAKLQRQRIGLWVLGFLLIFTVLAYCLKREYWKDIK